MFFLQMWRRDDYSADQDPHKKIEFLKKCHSVDYV